MTAVALAAVRKESRLLKIWARFIRLPNCFTAMADPVAGLAIGAAAAPWLLAREQSGHPATGTLAQIAATFAADSSLSFNWPAAGMLAAAGFLIYAAGIIFNDLADLKIDREKRPDRALPSGAISPAMAIGAAFTLAAIGIGLAWLTHPRTGHAAVAVFAAVLLYDFLFKRWVLTAAIGMALCRGLNLGMGLILPFALLIENNSGIEIPTGEWLPLPALYAALIAFLTTLSWTEERFPIKYLPDWKRQALADAAAVGNGEPPAPPPSLLAPRISFWSWVAILVLLSITSTALIKGNPLLSLRGFVQYLTMLGVFIVVYTQFAIFLKVPTRPNLGLTIRNGVLAIPMMWAGVVYAYSARDPVPAHTEFPGMYLWVSLAILSLYAPLIAAARWLKTKDA